LVAIEIVPFAEEHVAAAAALLAGRRARLRERQPFLSPQFDAPERCAELVDELRAGGPGFAALRAGRLAGYVLGRPITAPPGRFESMVFPRRSLAIGHAAYATLAGAEYDLLRPLYAALAERWVARGYFDHYAWVASEDAASRDAWDSLSFGRDLVGAVREVATPVPAVAASGVDVHLASPEDIEVVQALAEALGRHHAAPPIFIPFIPEVLPHVREMNAAFMADPANPHFVAYRDGRPLGMATFHAQEAGLVWPDRCLYLFMGIVYAEHRSGGVGRLVLERSMRWARERGYLYCSLHFFSPNLSGAAFWLGNGFLPVEERRHRRVDERIAWAGP
jgi:GNAT superfamily N-acetyltransferase